MASVYKYYYPSQYSRKALNDGYFWFSKARNLNDPFDICAEIINLYPHFKNFLITKYGDIKSFYTKAHKYAICCFTTDCLNKHMWALYADSYKGWCLEFDDEHIIDGSKTGVPPKWYEVQYVDKYPNFNNPNLALPIETCSGSHILNNFFKDDPHNEERFFTYLLSLKEKSIWETEAERRIFLGDVFYMVNPSIDKSAIGYSIPWNTGKLMSIIMGSNVSEENRHFLHKMAQKWKVELKQVLPIVPSVDFKLTIHDIKA